MNLTKRADFIRIFAIFIFFLTLNSCSTEDDDSLDSSDRSGFELEGEFYELSQSFIRLNEFSEEQEETTLYYHDVVVSSSGISLDENNETFTGTGQAITFTVLSRSEDAILDGTYSFRNDNEEFALIYGEVAYDANSNTGSATYHSFKGGSVVVKHEGNDVSLEFDLTIDNNERVTGNYEGEFEYYTFSL